MFQKEAKNKILSNSRTTFYYLSFA